MSARAGGRSPLRSPLGQALIPGLVLLGLVLLYAGYGSNLRVFARQGAPAPAGEAAPAEPPSYPHADLSPELRALLAATAANGSVIAALASHVSLSGHERAGVLDLFVDSAQGAGITNLLVAAYDAATLDWLRARGVPTLLRRPPPACEPPVSWVACAKADLARDVVALGYSLLLVDADVVFFRNPMEAGGFDPAWEVHASSDGMADAGGGPFGVSHHQIVQGWPPINTQTIGQLNYGVVWFAASRRLADTLASIAERIRQHPPVWDQITFSEAFSMPGSERRPWAGRHSVRVMDPLEYPNTCNLSHWLTRQQLAGARPVLLHFNCSVERRKKMQVALEAFRAGLDYLLEARECSPDRESCRPS